MAIKASEIADAISAIDAAIAFICTTDLEMPGRADVRVRLIRSRVDLEFSLKEEKIGVVN